MLNGVASLLLVGLMALCLVIVVCMWGALVDADKPDVDDDAWYSEPRR
jgi:hypothetical protein